MVKQSPFTISQTARSPEKLLELRNRLKSRKKVSEKTKHTFHKTREEVKLIDTNSLNLAKWQRSSNSRQKENFNGQLQNWPFFFESGKGGGWGSNASISNGNRDRVPLFPSLKSSCKLQQRRRCPRVVSETRIYAHNLPIELNFFKKHRLAVTQALHVHITHIIFFYKGQLELNAGRCDTGSRGRERERRNTDDKAALSVRF